MYKNKERVLIRPAPQTIERVKDRIREFTSRSKAVSMEDRIRRINAYLDIIEGALAPLWKS